MFTKKCVFTVGHFLKLLMMAIAIYTAAMTYLDYIEGNYWHFTE